MCFLLPFFYSKTVVLKRQEKTHLRERLWHIFFITVYYGAEELSEKKKIISQDNGAAVSTQRDWRFYPTYLSNLKEAFNSICLLSTPQE